MKMAPGFRVGAGGLLFALAAGCLMVGPKCGPEPPHNPVRQEAETKNRSILEAAAKGDGWVTEFRGWDGSGRSNSDYFERNYRYDFKCAKDESEFGRAGTGWLLPAAEYPRVIEHTQREFSDLISRSGGTITYSKSTFSTFELGYKIDKVVGHFRGRIGPVPEKSAPGYEQNVTSLQVDFHEEHAAPAPR
jgi:hypothetical protein